MIELQKGDKLVFKQDIHKETYLEEIRYLIGNIVTFRESWSITRVYIEEDLKHLYPTDMFMSVIRNGEVIWNERG